MGQSKSSMAPSVSDETKETSAIQKTVNDIENDMFYEGDPLSSPDDLNQISYIGYKFKQNQQTLAALVFFWFDQVQEQDKNRYFNLLGQLYELFITPQTIPVPPYRDCSFLKKMERVFSVSKTEELNNKAEEVTDENFVSYLMNVEDRQFMKYDMLNHIVNIFELENPTLVVVQRKLEFTVNNTLKRDMFNFFTTTLTTWFDSNDKTTIVFHVSVSYAVGLNHATFLALKKKEAQVDLIYIDPHGYAVGGPPKNTHRKQEQTRLFVQNYITSTFGVQVNDVLSTTSCPTLQTGNQGNNCVQWVLFVFALFLLNDSNSEDTLFFLENMRDMVNFNIHLFSLILFLRTMPHVGLEEYFFYRDMFFYADYDSLIETCVEEENKNRAYEVNVDCYNQENGECPKPCVQCRAKCHFGASVKPLGKFDCVPLSGKMIAKKMFHIYLQIRNMTRQDSTFTEADIEKQLNFKEPRTEKEALKEHYLHVYLKNNPQQQLDESIVPSSKTVQTDNVKFQQYVIRTTNALENAKRKNKLKKPVLEDKLQQKRKTIETRSSTQLLSRLQELEEYKLIYPRYSSFFEQEMLELLEKPATKRQ
jgi:hypothetical protein